MSAFLSRRFIITALVFICRSFTVFYLLEILLHVYRENICNRSKLTLHLEQDAQEALSLCKLKLKSPGMLLPVVW